MHVEEGGARLTGNKSEGFTSGSSPVSQARLERPPLPPPRPPRPPPRPPRDIGGRVSVMGGLPGGFGRRWVGVGEFLGCVGVAVGCQVAEWVGAELGRSQPALIPRALTRPWSPLTNVRVGHQTMASLNRCFFSVFSLGRTGEIDKQLAGCLLVVGQ
jgi:hypothetical protein